MENPVSPFEMRISRWKAFKFLVFLVPLSGFLICLYFVFPEQLPEGSFLKSVAPFIRWFVAPMMVFGILVFGRLMYDNRCLILDEEGIIRHYGAQAVRWGWNEVIRFSLAPVGDSYVAEFHLCEGCEKMVYGGMLKVSRVAVPLNMADKTFEELAEALASIENARRLLKPAADRLRSLSRQRSG